MQDLNNLKFKSHTGLGTIYLNTFIPENPNMYIIIIHGMAEHSGRYKDFAEFLMKNNIGAITFDLPGHGKTVRDESDFGYFGQSGYKNVIKDIELIVETVRENIPEDKKLVLFGHSMGSILARKYTSLENSNIDAAIYCGTLGPRDGIKAGITLAKKTAKLKGAKHRTKLIHNIMHSGFLKDIENPQTKIDWLTRDTCQINKYLNDPLCGVMFTAGGFRDMFSWIYDVTSKDWAKQIKDIPILLISGDKDPVGENGKGPLITYEALKETNHNVKLKLYEGSRHEVLNEINNMEVYNDILEFLRNIE